jgi:hypothetical protein
VGLTIDFGQPPRARVVVGTPKRFRRAAAAEAAAEEGARARLAQQPLPLLLIKAIERLATIANACRAL